MTSNIAAHLHIGIVLAEADLFSYEKVQMLLIWAQSYNASLKLMKINLSIDISTFYIKCLINRQDRCSTCGQRYRRTSNRTIVPTIVTQI